MWCGGSEGFMKHLFHPGCPYCNKMNYVLITSDDFQAFARNPHGLMELGFRDPQLHTTVLPQSY